MAGHQFGTEELDRTDVGNRLGVDGDRYETRAAVGQHQQSAIGEFGRAEEAHLGIGDRFDRTGRDLVAEDIGDAGVVAAAVEVTAVTREDKTLRHR